MLQLVEIGWQALIDGNLAILKSSIETGHLELSDKHFLFRDEILRIGDEKILLNLIEDLPTLKLIARAPYPALVERAFILKGSSERGNSYELTLILGFLSSLGQRDARDSIMRGICNLHWRIRRNAFDLFR